MRALLVTWRTVLPLLLAWGCTHEAERVFLTAPFNERTEIGEVTADWRHSGDERNVADGESEVRIAYRVDVRSRLHDPMYVELSDFRLVGTNGATTRGDGATVKCKLEPGLSEGVLHGNVWVSKHAAERVRDFRVTHFAVPLSDRGRALYREWLLQRRPDETAAIDAEIAQLAAAPPCG